MIFNQLNNTYSQIENIIAFNEIYPDPELEGVINEKLLSLTIDIKNIHVDQITTKDLPLLQKIGKIKLNNSKTASDIHNLCALLELKALLITNDPNKLGRWILKNKDTPFTENNQKVFEELSEARKQLLKAKHLYPEVGKALSHIITLGLKVKGEKNAEIVKTQIASTLNYGTLEALAHWINTEKIPLKDAGLSKNVLKAIAPYLHYVNFRDLELDDPEKFINQCSNAYHLILNDNTITELKQLPLQLQSLDCRFCTNLTTIDLSNIKQLQELDCSHCRNLKVLNLSQNLQLRYLYFSCTQISKPNLSNFKHLQQLHCSNSPISILDLSHNLELQHLHCSNCPISTLNLSNNRQLRYLYCSGNRISGLDLSHNLQLQTLYCSDSPMLTTLGPSLSNTLIMLLCQSCPNLAELPQVPPTTTVLSNNSLCGEINSFKVFPSKLEKEPKQVLLELGKILLQNKPMPNVVYMDEATGKPTAGLDAGGLRRQLAATLCENLFKEGSNFTFIKDGGYDLPILDDVEALRTFARLLGLAAVSHLPLGTNLHPSFFHALFALSDEELRDQAIPESSLKKLYSARHGLLDLEDIDKESTILCAIAIVAKELQALLGANFRQFEQKIDEFITTVQGSQITKENFKQSISCENELYKEWIVNFIDKLNSHELKSLALLLTGSYTLGKSTITFKVHPMKKYLESATIIHTCSRSMELPGDLTERLLHQELTEQLILLKSFNTV